MDNSADNNASIQISRSRSVSPIWFVPIIALIIALWLGFQAWQETGPTIHILFDDATGLSVGKTEVRYREVVVGRVINIRLAEDFRKVDVQVEMDPYIEKKISVNSRFWVVSPRISLSGVTGLNTLLSGGYIEMDPGSKGKFSQRFDGLTEAPAFRSYDKGTQYQLYAQKLGSLDVGSPVYHRDVKVGWVTSYRLLHDSQRVQLKIFIESPYDTLLKNESNFWNVSGLELNLGADGIQAKFASVASFIGGGIEFDSPFDYQNAIAQAKENKEFYLFPDQKSVQNGSYSLVYPYRLRFSNSVRGLKVGAPVEFKGIQVGEVTHVFMGERNTNGPNGSDIEVKINIQPERVNPEDTISRKEFDSVIGNLVSNGMRAQLKTSSLLTGALYVDLAPGLAEKGTNVDLVKINGISEIPTSGGQFEQASNELVSIIQRVNSFPFESMSKNLDESLEQINQLIRELGPSEFGGDAAVVVKNLREASKGLDMLMGTLGETLNTVDQTIAADSRLYDETVRMMKEISEAADSFEQLTDELSRYPNSLITGKGSSE